MLKVPKSSSNSHVFLDSLYLLGLAVKALSRHIHRFDKLWFGWIIFLRPLKKLHIHGFESCFSFPNRIFISNDSASVNITNLYIVYFSVNSMKKVPTVQFSWSSACIMYKCPLSILLLYKCPLSILLLYIIQTLIRERS